MFGGTGGSLVRLMVVELDMHIAVSLAVMVPYGEMSIALEFVGGRCAHLAQD